LAFLQGELSAREIVERSLNIAADICIYTNRNLTIEELPPHVADDPA
jgi:ATP-dependent protease HslVU (ClpYQ) peptidase subunit